MTTSTHLSATSPANNAVFPIEDDSLGRLIAMVIHRRLFGSPVRATSPSLRDFGWEDSLVTAMGDMPADDLSKIIGGSNSCVGVVFDYRKAAAVVRSYRALKRDQNDLEFFLANGATPALIHTLFPNVSSRTVTATRKRLGVESRGGRPRLPDLDSMHAIYRRWQLLCAQESNLRVRYMRLKEQFPAFSLATLCAAIDVK